MSFLGIDYRLSSSIHKQVFSAGCCNRTPVRSRIKFEKRQGKARIGIGKITGDSVVLARPQTGMNLSGESVNLLLRKFGIDVNDLIVIHDDLDLPPGKIRISHSSSSGGHKGVNSIMNRLAQRMDFTRIRVGISRPDIFEGSVRDKESAIIEYVLSDFTPQEEEIVARTVPKVTRAILCLLKEGLVPAMNKFN